MNITDDYDSFNNSTDNKNDDINVIIKYLLLSKPANIFLFSLIGSVYTMIKPLITNNW